MNAEEQVAFRTALLNPETKLAEVLPLISKDQDHLLGNSRAKNALYGAIGGMVAIGALALDQGLSTRDVLMNIAVGGVAGAAVGSLIKDPMVRGSMGAAYAITAGAGASIILSGAMIKGINKIGSMMESEEAETEVSMLPEVEVLPAM